MDDRQALAAYITAYKQAGDTPAKAPSAPQGRKDLTEKALAILRKNGRRRTSGKPVEGVGKEAVCPKCGNAVSKCACGKGC